jgi:hypothetical protein
MSAQFQDYSDKNSNNLAVKKILSIFLFILFAFVFYWIYMRPHLLMTDTARNLKGKELVEAENSVRGNVLSVAGAIFVIGTLWISIVQTGISEETLKVTLKQLEQERERGQTELEIERQKVAHDKEIEWKNKVEAAYIEWAEAFLYATSKGIYLARCKEKGDDIKTEETQKEFSNYHLIREKSTLRILIFEQREEVINIFKEINKYPYPHYPITQEIKDEAEKERVRKIFWNVADKDEKIIQYFHGIIKRRLAYFCDWIGNPSEGFHLPSFEHYLRYVEEKIPALKIKQ